ncbi:MAG: 6-carboxytetrahydropterin synthase [Parvularcula sp.]|nr:6-carboxytetrahydropterin synthase [Parvularcula sp.]
MFDLRYSFSFEAAHELGRNVASKDHPYAHVHGHSFHVTMFLRAEALGEPGWVTDFGEVRAAAGRIHDLLDHRFLNAIEGLEQPTLERMAAFIFDRTKTDLPLLSAVEIARPSLGEAVRYEPKA